MSSDFGAFREGERLDTEGVAVNAAGLPAMFAVAWMLDAIGIWPVFYFFQGTYHELGHATAAWLSGRFAFPIPLLLTIWSEDRSAGVMLLVLGSLLAVTVLAARARRIALALSVGTVLAVAVWLSFLAPLAEARTWTTFAGCGGEIVLSAIAVACFYVELPDRARWDFWRWPVVFVGCCVLVHATRMWRRVSDDVALLPRGTGIAGRGDTNGDMDKLIAAGWTDHGIADAYLAIARVAGLALLALYVARLVRALRYEGKI